MLFYKLVPSPKERACPDFSGGWGEALIIFLLFIVCSSAQAQNALPLITQSFDSSWKFLKEDTNGAEQTNFDDANWRSLNVPHNWSIEGPYDRNNTTGRGGGYLPGGIGWYRKTFSLNEEDAKKLVFIDFEGIMANSDVWINGFHLRKRPSGYSTLEYELTGHLNFGSSNKNVIAVRADNSVQPASSWYTGAGIYRHVHLMITNPVHVAHWGWGSFIADYFDTTKITIENDAIGGRSSRIFMTDGRWDKILQKLQKGDYVIMQFGHNDGGPLDDTARARGTIKGIGNDSVEIYNPIRKRKEMVHTYGWYMRKYVNDSKAAGAVPIVCSPIRRNIWKEGKVVRSNDGYALWAKEVAQQTNAYFINLNNIIGDAFEKIG